MSPCGQKRSYQVTHPLGCCCDNVGHVHLLGVRYHRRVDGSRRGVCSQEEARYLQKAFISHVHIIKLKLGLTRKMCQIVLIHHDLIGSARISERCKTGRHRLFNVFQHLWSHWHLYLLSDSITYSCCCQERNLRPFDKKTIFLVQLCVATFRLVLSRKNSVTVSARRSLQYSCCARQPRDRIGASKEMISDSVELCETEVCF